ncbi:MAG: hypothetical protein P8J33_10165, partial [Pirellulaceae bacterium]|nr:hypothetical protein [Pirellulaceae bacterium]
MIEELIYTSVPKGLKPGTKGYCTVAASQGMAQNLARLLESLSGYRHVFTAGSSEAVNNPVNHSYLTANVGGKKYSVVSRVSDTALDYSGRSNKLAHHIVFDASDRPAAGPAWLLGRDELFRKSWQGDPQYLSPRSLPQGSVPLSRCNYWEQIAKDAGWAGELAKGLQQNRTCYL